MAPRVLWSRWQNKSVIDVCGTIGGFYRATFHAVNRHPLIAAMLRRDRRVIGNYLRKRDMEEIKRAKDMKEKLRDGTTIDN